MLFLINGQFRGSFNPLGLPFIIEFGLIEYKSITFTNIYEKKYISLLLFHYCCNSCEKPLKRGVFCIFRGDATTSRLRDYDFRNQRPKIRIGELVWSQYNFEHPLPLRVLSGLIYLINLEIAGFIINKLYVLKKSNGQWSPADFIGTGG